MTDTVDPEAVDFIRAGAEKVVQRMSDTHRSRAAMIYAHITAITQLVKASGDDQELSQGTIEHVLLDLPMDYRSAFMLDTLNSVEVPKVSEGQLTDALARTERGQVQKRLRYEYKVMTVALTNAQNTANAFGRAGWRQSGQSTPPYLDPRATDVPAVVLTFERVLDDKKSDVRTSPANNPADQHPAVGDTAASEAPAGDGRGNRRNLPILG